MCTRFSTLPLCPSLAQRQPSLPQHRSHRPEVSGSESEAMALSRVRISGEGVVTKRQDEAVARFRPPRERRP